MGPAKAAASYFLKDGLGARVHVEGRPGVEALKLPPDLAGHPAVEPALHAAADRLAAIELPSVARVEAIDRDRDDLWIVAESPDGVRLSDLLGGLEAGRERMADAVALEIADAAIEA